MTESTNMNDRELLERAAKAAGIVGEYKSWTGQGFAEGIRQVIDGSKCYQPWNPLTDDGQALRLAADLHMDVFVRGEWVEAVAPMGVAQKVWYGPEGPRVAMRRAITRAATAMPPRKGLTRHA